MKLVWLVLAVVVTVNVALVAWIATALLMGGVRDRRKVPAPPDRFGIGRDRRLVAVPDLRPTGRRARSRLVATAAVVVVAFAGTAFASPRARDAVTSAMRAVGRIVTPGPAEGVTAAGSLAPAPSLTPGVGDLVPATGPSPAGVRQTLGSAEAPLPTGVVPAATSSDATSPPPAEPISPPATTGSPAPQSPSPPVTPVSLSAIATSPTEVSLSWTDVADETAFQLDRWTDGGWTTIATLAAEDTSYVDGGLTASTTYAYRVAALNDAGASAPSDPVSVTTPPVALPSPTVDAEASSSTKVVVTWSAVADATRYLVQRSTDGGGDWTTVAARDAGTRSFHDNAVAPATTYAYRVVATSGTAASAPSNVAIVNTPTSGHDRKGEPVPSGSASEG